ncbi:hypothetical protein GTZ99_12505 [Novosphingobium sp. FSY-8]|uniref:Uncharacterized protein n=1 Tax=Novosphingobium ovatum TaxID=1908523 RepID=A0ABW9XFQ8_9SPHN|nr:hypothetical protein [Novosphingobium ovatum]NBC37372.1 hypothetical protein [Novosphingobium ovatum]
MILGAQYDIAVNRWSPATLAIAFTGFDFTGAAAALHVRAYKDAGGDPLLSLSVGDGIAISVASVDGLSTSTLTLTFAEADIEALPFTAPRGGDLVLAYDLVITGGGVGKVRWLEGKFTVRAGVTV